MEEAYTVTAYRAASYLITGDIVKRLIADGIKNRYLLCLPANKDKPGYKKLFYLDSSLCLRKKHVPKEEVETDKDKFAIWQPSFIDKEVWTQAIKKFVLFDRLAENVLRALLPALYGPIEKMQTHELVNILKPIFLELNIIGQLIRKDDFNEGFYYFSETGYTFLDNKDPHYFDQTFVEMRLGRRFHPQIKNSAYVVDPFNSLDIKVWNTATENFKTGMTLEECIEIYLNTKIAAQKKQWSFAERLIKV